MSKQYWIWVGPLFVIIGASLWGMESFFRINLNTQFDSQVLVFHEHLLCLALTSIPLLITRPSCRHVSVKSWLFLLASGVIGSAIGTYFFTMSLRLLNPSVANVLLNFQPLVSVLFASLLLRERIGRDFVNWAGVALLCGLAIVANEFDGSRADLNLGLVYVALTALMWGFSTVAGRGAMLEIPLSVATFVRYLAGTVTLLLSLLLSHKWTPEALNWAAIGVNAKDFFYLSFVTGVIPTYFYFKGLQKTPASVGGFCELTQTFAALVLTWGILGNPLTPLQVGAGLALLVSIYKINLAHAKANHLALN